MGVIYALLGVRSPAPPIVALVGLLGILVGEQLVPLAVNLWKRETAGSSWNQHVRPHMFGELPRGLKPFRQNVSSASPEDRANRDS